MWVYPSPIAHLPMITVRVQFVFPSPSPLREELYSTLVSVTAAAFSRGEHLEIALWRARVLGYATTPLRVRVGSSPFVPNTIVPDPKRRSFRR